MFVFWYILVSDMVKFECNPLIYFTAFLFIVYNCIELYVSSLFKFTPFLEISFAVFFCALVQFLFYDIISGGMPALQRTVHQSLAAYKQGFFYI